MKLLIANQEDDKCVLANALRARRKGGVTQCIDNALLKAVSEVLAISVHVFDTLKFSPVLTLGNVFSSYYLMHGLWCDGNQLTQRKYEVKKEQSVPIRREFRY